MRRGKRWRECNAMWRLLNRLEDILLCCIRVQPKTNIQGHEQEVELQKAAHCKELSKIQQQLVSIYLLLSRSLEENNQCLLCVSGLLRKRGDPLRIGACQRARGEAGLDPVHGGNRRQAGT